MLDPEDITDAEIVGDTGTEVAPAPSAMIARHEEPIDGAWLLNLTDAWVGQHCYLADAARHTLALWAMAQHFRTGGRLVWDKFGHLLFIAEVPGSGKSTAMSVTGCLCAPWFFGLDNNPTAAGLCLTIGQEHATVAIDEAHRLVGHRGTKKADVVTIICASFERKGSYLNGRGGKATRVPVYAPMMLAAKKNPFLTSAGEEISDVIDRSVLIMMTKPPADAALRPVTEETELAGAQIAARAAAWAAQEMASPERMGAAVDAAREAAARTGLAGRDADVWLAMFIVAALASPGHLEAACQVAAELRLNRPIATEQATDPLRDLEAALTAEGAYASWGAAGPASAPQPAPERHAGTNPGPDADPHILADVALAWPAGERKMTSADLVRLLAGERGWDVAGEDDVQLAQRELAALLKPHGVVPTKVRPKGDPKTYQGYVRTQFPPLSVPARSGGVPAAA